MISENVLLNEIFSFNYFLTVDGKRYFGDIKQETEKYFIVELENEDRIIKILSENRLYFPASQE